MARTAAIPGQAEKPGGAFPLRSTSSAAIFRFRPPRSRFFATSAGRGGSSIATAISSLKAALIGASSSCEAPQKAGGLLHPQRPARRATSRRPCRSLMRARARAEATYNRLVMAVASAAALERDRAERALLLGVCMLCRRLIPQ
jgi:hypothetical protein